MNKKKLLSFLLFLTMCLMTVFGGSLSAFADDSASGIKFEGEMKIGERAKGYMEYQGIQRMFEYYIPSSYDGKRMPLMFTIPGSGHNSTMQLDEISNLESLAEEKGFILIASNVVTWLPQDYKDWVDSTGKPIYADRFMPVPDGYTGPMGNYYEVNGQLGAYVNGSAGYTSNSTHPIVNTVTGAKSVSNWIQAVTLGTERLAGVGIDDEGYFCALIGQFIDQGLVDKNRVFASGLSQGAFMSLRLAALHADIFAGAGIVSGELTQSVIKQVTEDTPTNLVKLVFFHGDKDAVVPSGKLEGGYYSRTDGPHPWSAVSDNFLTLNETIEWFLDREGLVMDNPEGVPLPHKDVMVKDYNSNVEYSDPTSITRYEYIDGAATVYWVHEGGHTWPGGTQYASLATVGQLSMQANASELMWEDLKVELLSETPSASVKKLSGNKNELTVSVTKVYDNGKRDVVTETYTINNNAADIYKVDDYKVYVDTKGNTQVRDCYIVE
jgi:poly(3-hydroxybutyrate) depolymerase